MKAKKRRAVWMR